MFLGLAAIDNTLMPVQAAYAKGAVVEERVEGAITVKYGDSGRTLSVAAVADADAVLRKLEKRPKITLFRA